MSQRHVLVVQNKETAKEDAPPFIPDSMLMEGLWGIKVFGPYDGQKEASDALRTFYPEDGWNLAVVPLISLSEALDNPHGYLWHGDAPDYMDSGRF
jgi:hypothetical protein